MWFVLNGLRHRCGQPRFADPRLPRDQHHPSLPGLRLAPAPQHQVDLFVTPDERRRLRAQCLETADDAAFALYAPGTLRLAKTGESLWTEILDVE